MPRYDAQTGGRLSAPFLTPRRPTFGAPFESRYNTFPATTIVASWLMVTDHNRCRWYMTFMDGKFELVSQNK